MVSRRVAALAEAPLRLVVSMPPRHGKSELLSHWTPVWFLANWPTGRVGLASFAADSASTWGRKARDTVRERQGDLGITLRKDLNRASHWELVEGGGMITAGVDGPMTGRGFDLLVVDDPIKNWQEANSAVMREHLWEWWRSTARTRLEPGGSIIVVATRWHEDDLLGRLLAADPHDPDTHGDRWEHIRLPALAEPMDPLGRAEGDPLWPARYDTGALADIRTAVGGQDWAGLYQQRPTQEGGGLFKLDWWQLVGALPRPTGSPIQFWDTAFKTGQQHDYSVGVTLYPCAEGYGLLDVWRDRVEFPALERAVISQAATHQPSHVYVEDRASGQSLVQTLRRDTRLPIVPVPVDKDKVARANAVTGLVESGRVFLPKNAPWVPAFLDELAAFPSGAHDDQVDAFVGGLTELARGQRGTEIISGRKESRWRL